jgi:hypothetical protein
VFIITDDQSWNLAKLLQKAGSGSGFAGKSPVIQHEWIIDKVKEPGLEKDILIVFVSDHGSWRHGKTTLHDFGMRVPMLCLWPGTIKPGTN